MERLIVGCGYLGLRAARAWLADGDRVAALTRSAERAAEWRALGIEPIVGDVLDPASLRGLPAAGTVLYAVGFDRSSGRSMRDVYVTGLANALDALRDRCDAFCYVSSSSVYGQSQGEWVDEDSPCEPLRENGRVCLAAESLVRERLPRRHAILRLAGIYGPGRLLRRIDEVRSGRAIAGRPDAWLNLIHVDDAVQAVRAASDGAVELCLASDDRPVTRGEYYATLAMALNAPVPTFEPEPTGRGDDGLNKRCSNRRLRDALGVRLAYPTIDVGLPHALRETIGA